MPTWNKFAFASVASKFASRSSSRTLATLPSGSFDESFDESDHLSMRTTLSRWYGKSWRPRVGLFSSDPKISLISRRYIMRGCYRGWTDATIDVSLSRHENHRGKCERMDTQCTSVVCPSLQSVFSVVSSIRSVGHSA